MARAKARAKTKTRAKAKCGDPSTSLRFGRDDAVPCGRDDAVLCGRDDDSKGKGKRKGFVAG